MREDRAAMMQNTAAIADEARQHQRKQTASVKCTASTVEPIMACENRHAGTIAHCCDSGRFHVGLCACWCGYRWEKFRE